MKRTTRHEHAEFRKRYTAFMDRPRKNSVALPKRGYGRNWRKVKV